MDVTIDKLKEMTQKELKNDELLPIPNDLFVRLLVDEKELRNRFFELFRDNAPQEDIDEIANAAFGYADGIRIYKAVRENKIRKMRNAGMTDIKNAIPDDYATLGSIFNKKVEMIKPTLPPMKLSVLENSYAVAILMRAHEFPGLSKNNLVGGGALYAKYRTLRILIDAGLLWTDDAPKMHNVKQVYLTDKGKAVTELLIEAEELLSDGPKKVEMMPDGTCRVVE